MKKKNEETFNMNEVRHLAGNYAIACLKGYNGSFENWYSKIFPDWRKIANEKQPKKKELYIVRLYDHFDGWIDVSEPVSQKKADNIFNKYTNTGTKNICYEDGSYYAIFPANTRMFVTPEKLGR